MTGRHAAALAALLHGLAAFVVVWLSIGDDLGQAAAPGLGQAPVAGDRTLQVVA